jgi:hypothetical protein
MIYGVLYSSPTHLLGKVFKHRNNYIFVAFTAFDGILRKTYV